MQRKILLALSVPLFAALFSCKQSELGRVKSVSLKVSTSIMVGAKETLLAVVAPTGAINKAVEWRSSDQTVATVSDAGEVTAVKNGVSTITVTTQDGGKTASCVVTVGALVQDPAGEIAAAGAQVTVTSAGALSGLTWKALLSNNVGFTLGAETSSGSVGSIPVTVALNPTNVSRSSTLTAIGSDATTHPIEIKQAAASLTYNSPSSSAAISGSAQQVTFTVTGTAGLTLAFTKTAGDESFKIPADITCDGTAQLVTVTMGDNLTSSERQAVYSATVTNAGASGLNLTGITVKQNKDDRWIQIGNLKWAKGNLIANGANECKIGAPTDYGLLFQSGSLIGYKGGSIASGGSGQGGGEYADAYWGDATSFSFANEAKVWPSKMVGNPGTTWPGDTQGLLHQWFFSGNGAISNTVNVLDEAKGVGDPCTYYLGALWRLPTIEECSTLIYIGYGNFIPTIGKAGYWFGPRAATGDITTSVFFTASGARDYITGSFDNDGNTNGHYMSSSFNQGLNCDRLTFYSGKASVGRLARSYAISVRCVTSM